MMNKNFLYKEAKKTFFLKNFLRKKKVTLVEGNLFWGEWWNRYIQHQINDKELISSV